MPAQLTTGVRALFAAAGVLLFAAPCFTSGCGSSSSPPVQATPGDASITYVSVTTGGGGAPHMGASSGSGDPFATPDSSSGSSGSTQTGDDATVDDTGAPDANVDGGDSGNECPVYMPRQCGTTTNCDLRTHTCCVSVQLQFTCVPGTGSDACPSNQASVHCLDSCECPAGKVCCGVENTLVGAVYSECQAVPNPGFCSPYPQTATEASAQFCSRDDECRNGQKCIAQTCEFNAQFSICGLQSQDPFNCHADQ